MATQLTQWDRPIEPMLKKKGFTIAGAELKFFPTGGLDERLSGAHLLELYSPDRLEPQWKREAAKKEALMSSQQAICAWSSQVVRHPVQSDHPPGRSRSTS